jgi:hypothetical protein
LLGKPEGKKPLGMPRHRLEDNFEMGLQEIGRVGLTVSGLDGSAL